MRHRRLLPGAVAIVLFFSPFFDAARAASNILIWPIDPVLKPDDGAAELWIQNQGSQPTTMQVRIIRWKQEGGSERYSAQQEVVASPPIVRIDGHKKQLIRLIKQGAVPANVEQAYRIVVDEIPQPESLQKPQMGLKLQMRYSIPLFVYGQGIKVQREGTHHALVSTRQLRWQVVNHNGKPAIQFTNNDNIHVRLSEVTIQQGGSRRTLAQGLLGYVLPGSSRSWPLPSGMTNPTQLSASVNARESVWRAPAQR